MNLSNDLRFAFRSWHREPLAAIAAALTLALGVGANTAIFGVIHAVMLKPLPYPEPERLVQLWSVDLGPTSSLGAMIHRDKQLAPTRQLDRWGELSSSFQDLAYYRPWLMNFSSPGEPARIPTALISADFFATLGATTARGRVFTRADLIPGKDRVVILSDGLWRSRFNADPAVLGKNVRIDGDSYTVIGMLNPDFRLVAASVSEQPDLFVPISVVTGALLRPESAFAIGRLKPGVSLQAASDEMNAIVRQLPPDDIRKPVRRGVNVVRLDEEVASGIRPALLILFVAAACVLLIACANIASLRLASTAARERELALRTALGATRARLVRQLLMESIAISFAGTILGLLLSLWAVRAIVNLYPERIPRLESLSPEPAVFAFTAGLAFLAAVLFGAAPAWRYSRPELEDILKGSPGVGGRRDAVKVRDLLITVQVASALVLLIGAGLLLRSFLLMRAIDPGYRRHDLLVAHFMLDNKIYATPGDQASFVRRLMDRIETIPSVEMAGATNSLPLDFNFLLSVTFGIEGRPELGNNILGDCRSVTPYFLQTMGIGLSAGRYLEPADSALNGGVLVNHAFAAKYFGHEIPVGKHLLFGKQSRTIVGVVTEIRDIKLEAKTTAALYMPFDRQPTPFVDMAIRTAADPRLLVNTVRSELRAVDPNQPMGKVTTMEDVINRAIAKPRWYAILIGIFAGLALLLAAIGIYSAVAFSVSRRTYEIGLRMALGAQRNEVLRMVALRGIWPSLAGVIIGLALAVPGTKLLTSFLYGIQPMDLRTYCVVALAVPIVALGAAYIPARRAIRIDPMAALRQE